MHGKFANELEIMAFPCNQFGGQEPGSNAEILTFVEKHGFPDPTHTTGFQIFAKTLVNGKDADAVFSFLKNSKPGGGKDIRWNYAKFLVGANGVPVKRYDAAFDLKTITRDIENLLDEKAEKDAEYDSGF